MREYNFKKIEKKWQKEWEKKKIYKVEDSVKGKKNFYHLVMFPYPSGNLHIGHWYNFAPADVYARFKKAQGYNVLSPIGFDAFGLPAENAAIKRGIHPQVWTYKNIKTMSTQLKNMGNVYDWSRQVVTADPEYYKWTQWMFLQLYKKNLAYRTKAPANWCPTCHTVLANEQVVNGECERCSTGVVQREIDQWLFRITKYADKLLGGLDKLDWPEKTKLMQKNWIGKSTGALIKFEIRSTKSETNPKSKILNSKSFIEVFTTRVDTIFGCTYVVVAPEHKLVKELEGKIQNLADVKKYLSEAARKSDLQRTELQKEKTGVELKGIKAINPFNGEEVRVFVADYVLGHYGTGAVMAVPAHDTRDFEFAKKYGLEIKQSIAPYQLDESNPPKEGKENTIRRVVHVILENNRGEVLTLNLKGGDWGNNKPKTLIIGGIEGEEKPEHAAIREIEEETGYTDIEIVKVHPIEFHAEFFAAHKNLNRYVKTTGVICRLKSDKQTAISEEEKNLHDIVWVKKEQLAASVTIPDDIFLAKSYINQEDTFTDDGCLVNSGEFTEMKSAEARAAMGEWLEKNKLGKRTTQYKLRDWLVSRQRYWGAPIPVIYCDKCGAVPVPEKNLPVVLPKVKKYLPTEEGQSPLAHSKDFVNTKCPKCKGPAKRETDTMDTFVCSSWYYLRYADSKNKSKFADAKKLKAWLPVKMYIGGAEHSVLHLLYSRFFTKALKDSGYVNFDEPFSALRHQGIILGPDGQKMSKSRGNVIDPDELVTNFGTDAVRLYLCFMSEYSQGGPWNPTGIMGTKRFLERAWRLQEKVSNKKIAENKKLTTVLHKTVKKVTEDISETRFNTAVSALMILLNEMEKEEKISAADYAMLIAMLAPFTPHFAEEVWANLGNKKTIHLEPWPKFNPKKIVEDEVNLVVQVNGKMRATIKAPAGISQQEAEKLAASNENVAKWLEGKTAKKVIFVPNKLINIVV